jgi:hypothetical protein
MRTKTFIVGGTSALLIVGSILVSCQKNSDLKSATTSTSGNTRVSSVANLENIINKEDAELLDMALALSASTTGSTSEAIKNCAPVITYDNPPGVYPRTVTVDFGPVNCYQPQRGLTRRGKTITTYFGDMADTTANSYFIQTYENYYVNDALYEGEVKVSHNSRNQNPQNVYRYTYINRKVTFTNGDYTIVNGAKRLVKLVEDGQYPGPLAFTGNFKVTGIVTGDVLEGGVSYQYRDSIDQDKGLTYDDCQFPVKGLLYIDFTNHSSWLIDYAYPNAVGSGTVTCDDQATLTTDGTTTPITLPFFRTDDY